MNTLIRNSKIDLYRVFFTLVIIIHHFQNSYDLRIVKNGYIAVDFFFILSGYFLGSSLKRSLTAFDYAKKRVQRLYPEYFVSICLSVILYRITRGGLDIKKIISELLLIQNSGLFTGGV